MIELNESIIKNQIADDSQVFSRGISLYEYGSYVVKEENFEKGFFRYEVDGNYGDYNITIQFHGKEIEHHCDCPYPNDGCKHTVAVLFDISNKLSEIKPPDTRKEELPSDSSQILVTEKELKKQVIEDRKERSYKEKLNVHWGENIKGIHRVDNIRGKEYLITLHDPLKSKGHCSCPDYFNNRLGICKHLFKAYHEVQSDAERTKKATSERFPYIDFYWDSAEQMPKLYFEIEELLDLEIKELINKHFDSNFYLSTRSTSEFFEVVERFSKIKKVRTHSNVHRKIENLLLEQELEFQKNSQSLDLSNQLKLPLYPFQEETVRECVFKKGYVINDEIGLGKTAQAIATAVFKKQIFDLKSCLVITSPSQKKHWVKEIEKFSFEKSLILAGKDEKRKNLYHDNSRLFKILDYHTAIHDKAILKEIQVDFLIIDDAEKISDFTSVVADTINSISKSHALALSDIPLQNQPDSLFSVMQVVEGDLLSPLWKYKADFYQIEQGSLKIVGFKNLNLLREKVRPFLNRRTKEQCSKLLPRLIERDYFVPLLAKQKDYHSSFLNPLKEIVEKKFHTQMDLKRLQELIPKLKRSANSTYLIDQEASHSAKLTELKSILDKILFSTDKKVVVRTEWTAMLHLIGKDLSKHEIPFLEYSNRITSEKREAIVNEFQSNTDHQVLLFSGEWDRQIQNVEYLINFDIPWNHFSKKESVELTLINLIGDESIEETFLIDPKNSDLLQQIMTFKGQETNSRDVRTKIFQGLKEIFHQQSSEQLSFADSLQQIGSLEHFQELKKSSSNLECLLQKSAEFLSELIYLATKADSQDIHHKKSKVRIDEENNEVTIKLPLPKRK